MISFQTEDWKAFARDAEPIFRRHWVDLALDKKQIELSVDHEVYGKACDNGRFMVVTARDGSDLVGYVMTWLGPHPHYAAFGLQSTTDAFYVLPERRRGGLGVRLLLANESELRKRGVRKMTISTKVHEDHSAVFEALGWTLTDKMYTKMVSA